MKKIIILLFVLLLSGCDVNYNLYMNKNQSFKENFTAYDENRFFDEVGKNYEEIINKKYEDYGYDINYLKTEIGDFKSGAFASKKYKNINELNKSPFFTNTNSKISFTKDGKYTVMHITSEYDFSFWTVQSEYDPLAVTNLNFTIDVPFKVIETNATSVDKTKYTWNLNDRLERRTFYIKYDSSKVMRASDTDFLFILLISISGIAVLAGIVLGIIWIINKKNNRI